MHFAFDINEADFERIEEGYVATCEIHNRIPEGVQKPDYMFVIFKKGKTLKATTKKYMNPTMFDKCVDAESVITIRMDVHYKFDGSAPTAKITMDESNMDLYLSATDTALRNSFYPVLQ